VSDAGGRPDAATARSVLAAFGLRGAVSLTPITSGHINESWRVDAPNGASCLLQWLNHRVFPQADAVEDNLETVLDHLARGPSLLRAGDGTRRVHAPSGLWRLFEWLPARSTHERPADGTMAREAGRALGAALHGLADLAVERVHPVLAAFHDLDARLSAFDEARAGARPARREAAAALLDRVDAARVDRLAAREVSSGRRRVLHGDPKFTNFLFAGDGSAVLVDWDTVMVGPLAWDFGDFLRSAASRGAEDDPAHAGVEPDLLGACADGFRRGLAEPLDASARSALADAPARMAFMLAVRFLTDHLDGDRYFRVRRPGQNLDRAAAQFALADDFRAQRHRIVDALEAPVP
jgi:Ser/Thr protein kinase RdoA (MazF antagonist)